MSDAEGYARVENVPEELRGHLGELILTLADNKRLLGIRYADWILGAPSVEAGIACSAMAQDEWGHGRIMYAMLKDFGRSPHELEHEREADAYQSSELLDDPVGDWQSLLALNCLLDTALSVLFKALDRSRFEPVHYKVRKLLEEERFHFDHGRGWAARMSSTEAAREAMHAAFEPAWGVCLRGFGPSDDEPGNALADAGITSMAPDAQRARWLERVGPMVEAAGLELAEERDGVWTSRTEPNWDDWSSERRRAQSGGPDDDTLARVRGDRNRALLMD